VSPVQNPGTGVGGAGSPGPRGAAVLSSNGPPDPAFGLNGDWCIDLNSADRRMYGPKSAGAWGAGFPLLGPQGTPGSSGGGGGGAVDLTLLRSAWGAQERVWDPFQRSASAVAANQPGVYIIPLDTALYDQRIRALSCYQPTILPADATTSNFGVNYWLGELVKIDQLGVRTVIASKASSTLNTVGEAFIGGVPWMFGTEAFESDAEPDRSVLETGDVLQFEWTKVQSGGNPASLKPMLYSWRAEEA
jgi:hypothetical protein